ncbi:MAG: hypothetical protein U1A24_20860 [Cypionkella sp.]|uniref:hypothetical protein n=1 Tax=Cypionkella sp. TaxID=2811411 RepID=UPI002AB8CC6D|nr:hypothetical protein [Cypionkella sp.]MDZ4313005.1 hypothetical protein [Cypionkella sp.]MDZ4395776.1 hypothetical protein [Cypionkella sp.]
MSLFNRTALYDTTNHRVFIALNVAAAIGAGLVTYIWAGRADLYEMSLFYFFAYLIWFFAILFLGGPIWFAMHKFGLRHWLHASLAGGVVTGTTWIALMTNLFTGYSSSLVSASNSKGQTWKDHQLTALGWSDALRTSLWISLLGVILGLIIWRVAYRRVPV